MSESDRAPGGNGPDAALAELGRAIRPAPPTPSRK